MNNSQRMQQSINELEQQLKQFEDKINIENNDNHSKQITNNGMSIQERDSIVDDLLNQYRSQNHGNHGHQQLNAAESQIDSIIGNHSNSNNYFANLQNVSYEAYCINDIDENENKNEHDQYQLLDWIDTLQVPLGNHQNQQENLNLSEQQSQDLIYNNNINDANPTKSNKMKRNLKNLKRKQKQKKQKH